VELTQRYAAERNVALAKGVNEVLRLHKEHGKLPGQMPLAAPESAVNGLPGLNHRARGWLRFLHLKATTEDDWSEQGPGPHPWWDGITGAPMSSFQRFDLHESSYAVVLMADKTPAWREAYSAVLDGLASRYHTHWAAVDWLNQFGEHHELPNYPEAWRGTLIPEHMWGTYPTPGWTANGVGTFPDGRPTGIEGDPIKAEGNLFFKGWLTLVMGLYTYVSGDDKYVKQPWNMANIGGGSTEWTLDTVVQQLTKQWGERECALH